MSDAECGVRGRYFSPGDIEFLYNDVRVCHSFKIQHKLCDLHADYRH